MADTTVGDIYLCTFRGSLAAQTILNTFAYRVATVDGNPTVSQIYDGLNAALDVAVNGLRSKFLDLMPSNYTSVSSIYQKIAPVRVASKTYEITSPGNFGFTAATANLAGTITRRGEFANRRNVSSLHLPYADQETGLVNGLVSANWRVVASALETSMRTPVVLAPTSTTMQPVIYNRGAVPNFSPIVTTFSNTQLRVMRRRTVGLGI
jgi:hypothetical protein